MRNVAFVVLLLASGLGGCATLVRGGTDLLYVYSEPSGARATTSTGASCTTPCSLELHRTDQLTVNIAKAGYRPQAVEVKTRIDNTGAAVFSENVATLGLGMAVDAATGAVLEHVPNPVKVTLQPLAAAPAGRS